MIKIVNMTVSPVKFLCETRDFMMSSRSNVSENVRQGLNYNIILTTVLILEGQSEGLLHSIVDEYEQQYIKCGKPDYGEMDLVLIRNINLFLNNSFAEMKNNISRNTGAKHYFDTFHMLLPECKLSERIEQLKESIQVLYQFRNVLAHGRALRYEEREYYPYPDYNLDKHEVDFVGGYNKVQEYLIKKGLISKRIPETRDYSILFTDEIFNHFVSIQKEFIEEWKKCVPFEIKKYSDEYDKL